MAKRKQNIRTVACRQDYKDINYEGLREKLIWITATKDTVPIPNMDDKHAKNCLLFLFKSLNSGGYRSGEINNLVEMFSIELAIRGIDNPLNI